MVGHFWQLMRAPCSFGDAQNKKLATRNIIGEKLCLLYVNQAKLTDE